MKKKLYYLQIFQQTDKKLNLQELFCVLAEDGFKKNLQELFRILAEDGFKKNLQELFRVLAEDGFDEAGAEDVPVLKDGAPVHLGLGPAGHLSAQLAHFARPGLQPLDK